MAIEIAVSSEGACAWKVSVPALGADTMRNPGDSSSSALASSATGRAFSTASIISGDPAELARDGADSSTGRMNSMTADAPNRGSTLVLV